jgi:predicted AAA+ superfamily ATPase
MYLEETYLVRRLPRFASSPKARLSHPKKIYACDTGLVSAIGRADGSDLGHRLENLVFLKLLSPDATLSHYVDLKEATLVTRSQRDVANLGGRFLHLVPAHEFLLQG